MSGDLWRIRDFRDSRILESEGGHSPSGREPDRVRGNGEDPVVSHEELPHPGVVRPEHRIPLKSLIPIRHDPPLHREY